MISETEAQVEALAVAEGATKRDFEHLEATLDNRFERLDGEIRLVKWMLALVVAAEAMTFMYKPFT